ncbi:TonB-dependent hemoglobin/transferrin/lactoferrin family receptor [Campylobacter sp. 9BO]|uniref:TonB-dependent hemoglobin/transferrin/lactoferrin family receptor n=1 Tax=Campylobacter sp. 9BO TaxID=3424759 RepID=UPI003D34E743
MLKKYGSIVAMLLVNTIFATNEVRLDEVSVTAKNNSSKKSILNKSDIKKGQIFNEKDLVRNETGVSVTEGGRSGNNGYAIRGVDSDRVSVKVDGMESAQSFMPRFYYIKGLMNGNRNSTELENLSSVEITKGANSLTKGSGAIGGSVSMQTKNTDDFVKDGENLGFYSKTGYASINNEFRQVTGAGVKFHGIEVLFQHTYKNGDEYKNYYSGSIKDISHCGMTTSGENNTNKYPNLCSFGRILPDTVDSKSNSRLAKLGYRYDDHFINSFYEDLKQEHFTEQKSNSVASANRRNFNEKIPYERYGIYYEYEPSSDEILSYFKAGLSKQKVQQISHSTQYNAFPGLDAHLNDKIDKYRSYEFSQKRTQFDSEGIFGDIGGHIFSFGAGLHKGEFSNENTELTYRYHGARGGVDTKNFTYQQPVESRLFYAYLRDDISVNDALSLNFGIRTDRYTYTPKISDLKYENTRQQIQELPKSKFNAFTYEAGFEYEFADDTAFSYAFSTGFRAPKVEEMYFEMGTSNSSTVYARNLDLKPEKAQNHEISLVKNSENYAVAASAFYTKYRDFIDIGYDVLTETRRIRDWSTRPAMWKNQYFLDKVIYKQTNIDQAYIKGIELNARLNGTVLNLPDEYFTTLKATYQKGRKSDGTSLMAVQPFTAILGIGYEGEKLNLLLTSKYVRAKKQKDAMDFIPLNSLQVNVDKTTGDVYKGDIKPHPYLSSSYLIYDLTAGYKITKNFSINAGIFNLFDKKYTTWESLRQLRYNGNQGYVLGSGVGLERYTAAGRNFSVSFEMRY